MPTPEQMNGPQLSYPRKLQFMLSGIRELDGPTVAQVAKHFKDHMTFEDAAILLPELAGAGFLYVQGYRYYLTETGDRVADGSFPVSPVYVGDANAYQEAAADLLMKCEAKAVLVYVYQGHSGDCLQVMALDPTLQINIPGLLESIAKSLRSKAEAN